ncbi:type IV pilus assembly protein FimV [Diaphorobacter aerolatus]|uniref:type IV pilus assembly protein FimV n=1 Tax=Diaphorobacter aerolatus TaxID=1288495 RepID=UPI00299F7202|nr:hypothetical protein [Diaphorobacter aerolatus]
MRADIDLPQVSAAEAESLKASTATADVYRAQGLDYTPSVNDIRVQFQRRPDGTGVLRLSSSKAINDPFIDLVIDATWASGHIVRSYTMLLDPPEMRRQAEPQTTAPQISSPDSRFSEPAAPSVSAPAPAPRNLPQTQERRQAPTQRMAPAPARWPTQAVARKCACVRAKPLAASPVLTVRQACRSTRCWSP